jgi:hypothetical protein
VIRAFAVLLAATLMVVTAAAQEKLTVSPPEPGTIRLNDTSIVRITVEGVGANPRSPKIPKVDGLEIRQLPATTSTQRVRDGRRSVTRTSVQFGLELRPQRVGLFTIPSFKLWTGTKEQVTPVLRLEVREDLVSKEMAWLEVDLQPKRVYVHEPVRVKITFAVLQGVRLAEEFHGRTRYQVIAIVADWLEIFPAGEAIELVQPRGDLRAVVCNEDLSVATFVGNFERNGQMWQRFQLERAFLPSKVGRVVLPAPELRFHALRHTARPLRGGQVDKYGIVGKPIEFEVLPIPEEGRPSPYFGAVGRFGIRATLDKDRIKFGDSFKLTLTATGTGNFEFLRMPELDDLKGFHKRGAAEAQRDGDRVVVTYDLTPLSTDVAEIPSIEWNYFDTTPGVAKFVEVATEPLAIVVDELNNSESIAPLPEAAAAAVTAGIDDIFDLPSFDGPARPVDVPESWLRWLVVVAPWALMLALLSLVRSGRRASMDTTGKRVRGAKRQFDAALARDADAMDAIAAYLGDRLDVPAAAVITSELAPRLIATGLDETVATEVAVAIERGTTARYGGGQALTADEARGLVQRLESTRFGARGWLPFLLLPALVLSAQDLQAQEAEAVDAYRQGDYVAADAAFANAYDLGGDRRHLRARGNCLYRMGDLPRARWAFESARIALPRDEELLANLRVVRTRLELPQDDGGFATEIRRLLDRYTLSERTYACLFFMLLAAGFLVFGWRRIGWRWVGAICLVPGGILALDVLWLAPSRAMQAVALQELLVTAEPRAGMDAVAIVRPGALVDLLGSSSGEYVRIDASGRSGYVAADAVAVIK